MRGRIQETDQTQPVRCGHMQPATSTLLCTRVHKTAARGALSLARAVCRHGSYYYYTRTLEGKQVRRCQRSTVWQCALEECYSTHLFLCAVQSAVSAAGAPRRGPSY
jgi:hypothetical protein